VIEPLSMDESSGLSISLTNVICEPIEIDHGDRSILDIGHDVGILAHSWNMYNWAYTFFSSIWGWLSATWIKTGWRKCDDFERNHSAMYCFWAPPQFGKNNRRHNPNNHVFVWNYMNHANLEAGATWVVKKLPLYRIIFKPGLILA
jgi:hypothetical protein